MKYKIKKSNKKKILLNIFFPIAIIVSALFFLATFILFRLTSIENYCREKSNEIVGNNWYKEVLVTEDIKNIGVLKGLEAGKSKIWWGVSEQLRCKRDQKFFFFL